MCSDPARLAESQHSLRGPEVESDRRGEARCGNSPAEARRERRSEEHTSELQSPCNLVCRLLLEKKKKRIPCHVSSSSPTTPSSTKLSPAIQGTARIIAHHTTYYYVPLSTNISSVLPDTTAHAAH